MEFLDHRIQEYAESHTKQESDVLARLNRDTYANVLMPRMLSGHLQGRILSLFSKMVQPRNILEIGTYTGYSALCMVEGLKAGGKLYTIDRNEELETRIRKFITQAGYENSIELHIGDALKIIPELNVEFDMVFIDADKENYLNYYNLLIDKLPSGALIIADNVLWSGKVLDEEELKKDEETRVLDEFNTFVTADERVENVLFPVRDGLMVVRKV